MKVNLQKIIVIISVLAVIIPILNISVFAENSVDTDTLTPEDYLNSMSQIIDDYANGKISFDEFNEQSDSLVNKYTSDNATFDSEATKKVYALVNATLAIQEKVKVTAKDKIKDIWDNICGKNNVPTETVQIPITNLGGYGAVFRWGSWCYVCDYVIVDNSNPTGAYKIQIGRFNNDGRPITAYYLQGGKWVKDLNGYGNSYSSGFIIVDGQIIGSDNKICKLYGDVRYINGEQYPTDDEWEYGTLNKFDEMPEKDLEELLNDFYEELELLSPDLSTIEGLLKSIYFRLGTLDSDNDNQLLSEVLAAIKAIKSTDTDNSELLELLEEIKNSLVFNDGENTDTLSEQLKKIIDNQITLDDFVIDEDLYNNHGEILKERLLGKFSFIYNMKTFVAYCFDEYSNTSESPEFSIEYNNKSYSINFNVFNDYMPTIQWILAAFIYLTYAYHTYRKIPSYISGGDNE